MTQPPRREPILDAIEQAPIDDEPVSDEERRAIAEAKKRGRFVTTAALKERLAKRSKQR